MFDRSATRATELGGCGHMFASICLATVGLGSVSETADAQAFSPEEVLVSDPVASVMDVEFEPLYGRFTWINRGGKLWVGHVDSVTGALVPANGRGTLVDDSALPPGAIGNGSEWVLSQTGAQIVYTRDTPQGRILARAYYAGGNKWTTVLMPRGLNRFGPYGSMDMGDPNARIVYRGPLQPWDPNSVEVSYWRNLDDANSETRVGPVDASLGRWIPGSRQLVYAAGAQAPDSAQIFIHDIDTGLDTQITDNTGDKKGPRVWTAPDFDNRRAMTVVNDREVLEVYVESPNPDTQVMEWSLAAALTLPPEAIGPYIWNARAFTHGGFSYAVLVAAPFKYPEGRGSQTEIWLAGPLGGVPDTYRISDDTEATRTDPEILEIQGLPYIYIYRYAARDSSPTGIYKLATGL